VQQMPVASRTRLQRRSSADASALLHELGIDALRAERVAAFWHIGDVITLIVMSALLPRRISPGLRKIMPSLATVF